jgi:hypothetical protein
MNHLLPFLLILGLFTAKAEGLLLVVESSIAPALAPSLDQYRTDIAAEGWSVTTLLAPAASANRLEQTAWIRREVWPKLVAHQQVLLVGNVPMPRSGLHHNPDGHTLVGCYSAPAYYVTPSAGWTDKEANRISGSMENLPNDGRFDNHTLPAAPQSGVSIVNYPGNASKIAGYFDRLHAYRTGQWNTTNLALYAYASNTTAWANAPKTVANLNSSFGKLARFNSEIEITKNFTNRQPSVALIAYKTSTYAQLLSKGVAPKSVAWLGWQSGQFELRAGNNSKDVYNALLTKNGPLVVALNHPDWTMRLKASAPWGDIWRETIAQTNAPTWIWIMGDPTLLLKNK